MGERASERALMRLLVLEGAGLAVPEVMIESIESVADLSNPRLADLVHGVSSKPATEQPRRVLRLQGGGAVDVPAAMHIVEHVELLEFSDLLRPSGGGGIIGVVELPGGLSLVCDPRELVAQTQADR